MTLRISVFLAVFLLNVTVQAQSDDPGLEVDAQIAVNLSRVTRKCADGNNCVSSSADGRHYAEMVYLLRVGKVLCEYGNDNSTIHRRCIGQLMEAAQTSDFKVLDKLCMTAVPAKIIRMPEGSVAKPNPDPSRDACQKEAKRATTQFAQFRTRVDATAKLSRAEGLNELAAINVDILKSSATFRESVEKIGGLRPSQR